MCAGNVYEDAALKALKWWLRFKYRVTHCTRMGPLPLLPSGPGGVGGIASRRTRHRLDDTTRDRSPSSRIQASPAHAKTLDRC